MEESRYRDADLKFTVEFSEHLAVNDTIMKRKSHGWIAAILSAACIASSVGCYPAYPPPNNDSAYNQDSKDYIGEPEPVAPQRPAYRGVDPGLVVAGAVAAGVLGYAIGNHHSYPGYAYYGPRYYRPVAYGRAYCGPRYYR